LSLQEFTGLNIQSNEFAPRVLLGIAKYILPIHPADVRALGVNAAAFVGRVVVPAGAVTTIKKAGFFG